MKMLISVNTTDYSKYFQLIIYELDHKISRRIFVVTIFLCTITITPINVHFKAELLVDRTPNDRSTEEVFCIELSASPRVNQLCCSADALFIPRLKN